MKGGIMHKIGLNRGKDDAFKLVRVDGKVYEQRTSKCGKVLIDDELAYYWKDVSCRDCWNDRTWLPQKNDHYGYKGGPADE